MPFLENAIARHREFACIDGSSVIYEEATSVTECDFAVLPYAWNSYLNHHLTKSVIEYASKLRKHNKYLIVWGTGDLETIVPIQNALYFQNGLHRLFKRVAEYAFELPAFWPDYLQIYFDGQMQIRNKKKQASVGFCGQGSSKSYKIVFFTLRSLYQRIQRFWGRFPYVPPQLIPSTVLRNRVLRTLASSTEVDTAFIIRDRYRAGVRAKADRDNYYHQTKVEFVNNIIDTDYTLCIRGGGNFSVRFYETLSCGRIPIFVDTDSRLPFDFLLPWKKYCLWINMAEIRAIGSLIEEYHSSLNNTDFRNMQNQCREVWVNWLEKDAFLEHFCEHLIYIKNQL